MIESAVAELEGKLSLEGLSVCENGLSFDWKLPPVATDHSVPGPQVAGDRQRHLGAPAEAWMKLSPKSVEQRDMSAISERITSWIGADRQIQADDCATCTDELDGRIRELASLKSTDLGVGLADSVGDDALTQSGAHPSVADVGPETLHRSASDPPPAVRRTFASRHGATYFQRRLAGGLSREYRPWNC